MQKRYIGVFSECLEKSFLKHAITKVIAKYREKLNVFQAKQSYAFLKILTSPDSAIYPKLKNAQKLKERPFRIKFLNVIKTINPFMLAVVYLTCQNSVQNSCHDDVRKCLKFSQFYQYNVAAHCSAVTEMSQI